MTEFNAVLLKPLDQQADRDENFIDPVGVEFDPEASYPIFADFDYSKPPVGSGRVSRAEDGTLIVTGELTINIDHQVQEGRFPYSLAIGVQYDKERNGTPNIPSSKLMGIGLTAKHVDPTQPQINIIRRDPR